MDIEYKKVGYIKVWNDGGWNSGFWDQKKVYECQEDGQVVSNKVLHTAWHEEQSRTP